MDRDTRRSWWCGWIPRSEWILDGGQGLSSGPQLPAGFPSGNGEEPFPSVCPGYSTILPAVVETGRALTWRREGNLSEFYDGQPVNETAKFYMDILASEVARVERHAIRFGVSEAKKKGREPGG